MRRYGARVAMRLLARTTIVGYGALVAAEHIGVLQHLFPPPGWTYCGTCFANIPKPAPNAYVRVTHVSSGGLCNMILCASNQALIQQGALAPPAGAWRFAAWYKPSNNRWDLIHSYARAAGQGRADPVPVPLPQAQRPVRHLAPALDAALPDIGQGDAAQRLPYAFAEAIKPLPSKQTRESSYDEYDAYNPRWVVPPVRVTIRIPGVPGTPVSVRPAVVPGAIFSVGTGRPEVKMEVNARSRAAFRMAAFASEAGDFLEVLYRSLPPDIQARYARNREGQVLAVWNHWRELNLATVFANLAINEVGDMSTAQRVRMRNDLAREALGGDDLWRLVNFGGI